ncbi:hypothetical protein [Roseomonas rosulenta]|nr:hypothetical protein [Roseomonas rosulenta]
MTRNTMYFVGGALLMAAAAFGYWIYQDRQRSGIDISIGGRGITVQER